MKRIDSSKDFPSRDSLKAMTFEQLAVMLNEEVAGYQAEAYRQTIRHALDSARMVEAVEASGLMLRNGNIEGYSEWRELPIPQRADQYLPNNVIGSGERFTGIRYIEAHR
jgi:hypothetical protein